MPVRETISTLCLAALALVALATACGPTRAGSGGPEAIDPLWVAGVLPTPTGLADGGGARAAVVEQVQELLAGRSEQEGADRLRFAGFVAGATREWTGPGGARLTLVTSAWDDRLTATTVGAGAVALVADLPEAAPWTPRDLPGSRGAVVADPELRVVSQGVGANLVYARAEGPVPERAVVRTLELAVEVIRGGGQEAP